MTQTNDKNSANNPKENDHADINSDISRQRNAALELHKAGNLPAAEAMYRAILQATEDGLTWHYLAVLQGQLGKHKEVVHCCEQALRCKFSSASVFRNLGLAQAELGQQQAAIEAIEESLSHNPDDAPLTVQLVRLHLSLGKETQALNDLRTARARFPNDWEIATELGGLAAQLNLAELAESAFQAALQLQPQEAASLINLGNILQMRGEAQQSVKAYAQALFTQPDFPEVYWYLAQNIPADSGSEWPDKILDLAASTKYSGSAPLQFAAGKVHHDAGHIDAAFSGFQAGNQLIRRSYEYSVDADMLKIRGLLSACKHDSGLDGTKPEANSAQYSRSSSPQPVFIVGMPRSGSTLLEQLLARHPNIAAGGEITWMQRFVRDELNQAGLHYPEDQLKLNSQQLSKIREKYLPSLIARGQGARFVTDKLPANFLCIPTIRRLFPDALIIHTKRELLETCWSCYRHLFSGPQQFAYELSELGQYGRTVHEFIQGVMPLWPDYIVEIELECLIENTELEMRRLLAQLGLPWHEDCLQVEESAGIVMTASALQVRQGINRKAVSAAAVYSLHLQELHNALQPTNVDCS